ncbi:plasma membrane fusion protein PRM1 [Ceratobasidium sp. AG-Ba]|nr:plasma membrane fusion protein PRM1 [Ceratobasidium sp. AG-Ba]
MAVPRLASPPPLYAADSLNTPQAHFTSLKPYLTLPYLLSLTWLATPILSLLFIIFRLIISQGAAQDGVEDAKGVLIASCAAAERAAQGVGSIGSFMAAGTNRQIEAAVNATIDAARATMIFRHYRICLAIIIGALTEITNFLQSTISGLKSSIQGDIQSANNAIASAVNAINSVTKIVNVQLNVPQFDIPALSGLDNIKIPTDLQDALTKLNATLPTLDQIRNTVDSIIAIPFDEIKKEINETFASPSMRFNTSVLAVPARSNITFCHELDTSIVDDLGRDLRKIGQIGIVLLLVSLVLLILGAMALEWYKWRVLQSQLERTREAWTTDSAVQYSQPTAHGDVPMMAMTNDNMMMLHVTQQHPLMFAMANKLAIMMKLSATSYTHLRFFLAYIFHPAALACLLIGLFGLISVEVQLAAIGPIQKHYSTQVSNSVGDFTNSIALSINGAMQNDSASYAAQVNAQTMAMQTTINDGLFGWVNGTTVTLNNTLVAFYSDVQNTVDAVFGGTILETPAQEFVRCLIGTKVQGLENALTFIHDHLKVNMPVVSNDVLLLSNSSVNEITQPISLAAVGDGEGSEDGSGGGIVGKVIARYVASLKKERVMFLIFLGIWGFVVLIGLCIVLWHTFGSRWLHNRRQRAWEQGQSFGPFSRRPSEQSHYAFPGVPGGQPLGVVHGRALWEEQQGGKKGVRKFFGGSTEGQEVKWEEGQNVHAVVHVQGGKSGGWVGRLKDAMARRKAEKQSLEPVPFTNFADARGERTKSRGLTAITMPEQEIETSTWSASPTAAPPKPWNPLVFAPRSNKSPEPVPPPMASRTELAASFIEDARPVIYDQGGALPLHMHFAKRPTSPDGPITPPGLPVSVGHTPNEIPVRQVPPVSTVPGGRVPQIRRHRAQNSSVSIMSGGNPFATPFDDDRADGRYPVTGRAI